MVQLLLGNLSRNIYMVGSLYIREVVCNPNIQHDQGTLYSQSAQPKATKGYPGNDIYRGRSETLQDFESEKNY